MGDRARVQDKLTLITSEGAEVAVDLVDHSPEGAKLMLDRPVRIGTSVELMVNNDPLRGVVRYCTKGDRGGYTIGLKFGA